MYSGNGWPSSKSLHLPREGKRSTTPTEKCLYGLSELAGSTGVVWLSQSCISFILLPRWFKSTWASAPSDRPLQALFFSLLLKRKTGFQTSHAPNRLFGDGTSPLHLLRHFQDAIRRKKKLKRPQSSVPKRHLRMGVAAIFNDPDPMSII